MCEGYKEIKIHVTQYTENIPADLEDIKHDLESKLGSEFQRKLQWARSMSSDASEAEAMDAGKSLL